MVIGVERTYRVSWWAYDLLAWSVTTLHPAARRSSREFEQLKDTHRGERCFILGNGPSLNETDLSLLLGEQTFGQNRVYLLFDRIGFATTYLVCTNPLVMEQWGHEMASTPSKKFFLWRGRRFLPPRDDILFFQYRSRPHFADSPVPYGLGSGATVTYAAMQLAYHMGFSEVILVGVDHYFATTGPSYTVVVSPEDDPNHFDPSYFGRGTRWELPDLEASELAYRRAKARFEADGRRILDATIGGNLTVFPKVAYSALFKETKHSSDA